MKAYEFFGLDAAASKQDVQVRYMELKSKFSAERFDIGEAGENAAKNLDLLEVYYKQILGDIKSQEDKKQYGNDLGAIEQVVIKDDDMGKAQSMLDEVTNRTGEWHYLQSIVFYKNNWFLESKKQLEFALVLEPENPKFIESYQKLTKIIATKQVNPQDLRSSEANTHTAKQATQSASPCTGNCCCDLCLADTCCECMGGDCC